MIHFFHFPLFKTLKIVLTSSFLRQIQKKKNSRQKKIRKKFFKNKKMSGESNLNPIIRETKQLYKQSLKEIKDTEIIVDNWANKTISEIEKKQNLINKEKNQSNLNLDLDEEFEKNFEKILGPLYNIPVEQWSFSDLSLLIQIVQQHSEKIVELQNKIFSETEYEKNNQQNFNKQMENQKLIRIEEFQKQSLSLIKFQKFFGVTIEKVPQAGKIKLCFSRISVQNPKQIFSFVLGLNQSTQEYEIFECLPPVDYSTILKNFNRGHISFQQFILEIRKLFLQKSI